MSGSGISWDVCKSAPRSRQITTPALHYSSFLQAGCPSCRPTNSVKALKANKINSRQKIGIPPARDALWESDKANALVLCLSLQRSRSCSFRVLCQAWQRWWQTVLLATFSCSLITSVMMTLGLFSVVPCLLNCLQWTDCRISTFSNRLNLRSCENTL